MLISEALSLCIANIDSTHTHTRLPSISDCHRGPHRIRAATASDPDSRSPVRCRTFRCRCPYVSSDTAAVLYGERYTNIDGYFGARCTFGVFCVFLRFVD